ncbi:putative plasmid stability protein stbB [Magnetospirillum gryphiswaldense MSR-1 v2]|uniref:Ribonuclease VapC n=1 Tax=Magnetospirillum gryphiswaldense (strain DSM 6361 / JCM 21280 / NBRC 15271 / MSR-1) TaxID=431944 RepID=V6EXH1_MAGGM|nr:type II toxin-antitoxin system VapC family toxin [Magnetospirillum gryphiswaldense]CDK97894.1 putative plasmid stability protein stbB [Magnetospirillum gryphiswaldense MSR-1 v2]
MFLLDTVVLSELRKRDRSPNVVRWLTDKAADDIFLSSVTIGEIERGIVRQRVKDPAFAEALESWLDRTIQIYGDRILPVDTQIARRWGSLSARIGNDGADLLIAATALEHGLTVVTRNIRHFEPTGVALIDPFE